MLSLDVKRYWGDDFDVRFYLVSRLKGLENCRILDLGGGIGSICSELAQSNTIANLDLALDDLRICQKTHGNVGLVCGSMTELPFQDGIFDVVICAHIIEEAKNADLLNDNTKSDGEVLQYPSVERALSEIKRVLKNDGTLYLTTPNNSYYQSTKLSYSELKRAMKDHFKEHIIYLFNTYPRLSRKYRKLNMASVIPKVRSKLELKQKILDSMLKPANNEGTKSVSFFVQAIKD